MAQQFYICIRKNGDKYVVNPANEKQYQADVAAQEKDVWYFAATKPVSEFAQAGVFGIYNSFDEAKSAILAVEPGSSQIYVPPSPINPT